MWLLVILFASVLPSQAGFTQSLTESGVGNFNELEAFIFGPGAAVAVPGFASFSDLSWTSYDVSSEWAVATGATVATLNFSVTAQLTGPGVLDLFVLNAAGSIVDSAALGWGSNGFTGVVTPFANPVAALNAAQAAAAPEPGSLILSIIGLLLLVWRVGTRRRTNSQ